MDQLTSVLISWIFKHGKIKKGRNANTYAPTKLEKAPAVQARATLLSSKFCSLRLKCFDELSRAVCF